jgi:hypothetical protein
MVSRSSIWDVDAKIAALLREVVSAPAPAGSEVKLGHYFWDGNLEGCSFDFGNCNIDIHHITESPPSCAPKHTSGKNGMVGTIRREQGKALLDGTTPQNSRPR